jgi:nucleotide-binding universal stress UspA family protein
MTIVIGVDDSPHSKAAVEYVKAATWPKGVRVVVVSAVPPVYVGPGEVGAPGVFDRLIEEQTKSHREIASRFERAIRDAGLAVETRVPAADPRVALVDAARSERADLIVVGSHGRSGLAKLLIGSVASHVVTHAPCSVLVVKTAGGA